VVIRQSTASCRQWFCDEDCLAIHRMLLHASRLEFAHPASGERLAVEARPDAAFARALALFDGARGPVDAQPG